ncbi:hypothetical protein L2755_15020 [Shewanella abyssi]|uniref:hypothetical protein n=1 Tax=Shewanella abyssi TaxID=311789 RepID=UPI00200BBF75|nr:hypothetical protein [Shewanella abyssi]MCL1050929.1 hypothetical protein [Shewanella abyssi]
MQIKSTKALLTSLCLVIGVTSSMAYAASSRTLTQSYEYDGQAVSFDMELGSAKIIATDDNDIRVEVVVDDSDSHWLFFWGKTDLDNIKIDAHNNPQELSIGLSEQDNIQQEWIVYLPKQAALVLEMGVGQIEVSGMTSDIDIDLGVGSARVEHQTLFSHVELDSAVGEVSITELGQRLVVKRGIINQSYSHTDAGGNGDLSINVGVGEIVVVKR